MNEHEINAKVSKGMESFESITEQVIKQLTPHLEDPITAVSAMIGAFHALERVVVVFKQSMQESREAGLLNSKERGLAHIFKETIRVRAEMLVELLDLPDGDIEDAAPKLQQNFASRMAPVVAHALNLKS